MAPNAYVQERLCELREEAYCKVLKCFVAGQLYDLKKELMLSQLRAELCISDERHDELRQSVSAGEERPWLRRALFAWAKAAAIAAGQPRGGYGRGSSEEASEEDAGAARGGSPYTNIGGGNGQKRASLTGTGGPKPMKKRLKKGSAEPEAPTGGPTAAGAEGAVMGMNPLVGHKVDRYWDDGKWWSGIITDYNGLTGEHCIVYAVGTSDESFEWLDVNKASQDELRVLDETVNVLDLGLPPSAQEAQPEGRYPEHMHSVRGGQGGRKSGMVGAGRGPKAGSRPGYPGSGLMAKESGVYHPQGYTTNNMGRTVPARPIEMISSDDDDF